MHFPRWFPQVDNVAETVRESPAQFGLHELSLVCVQVCAAMDLLVLTCGLGFHFVTG